MAVTLAIQDILHTVIQAVPADDICVLYLGKGRTPEWLGAVNADKAVRTHNPHALRRDSMLPERSSNRNVSAQSQWDIVIIDTHSHTEALENFRFSLQNTQPWTIWIVRNTIPADPYDAYPSQSGALFYRKHAGLARIQWTGDVYKAIPEIHDAYPDMSYCTVMSTPPVTVIWKSTQSRVERIFHSLDEVNSFSYFDMLDNTHLYIPISINALSYCIYMNFTPIRYSENRLRSKLLWKKLGLG